MTKLPEGEASARASKPTLTAGERRNLQTAMLGRVEGSFLAGYLTLISIIQGVSLAELGRVALADGQTPTSHQWLLVVFVFVLIATVWQEYHLAALAFAWTPTVIDAIIPFGLGVIQVYLAGALTESLSGFVIGCAVFGFAGTLAYANCVVRVRSGLGSTPQMARLFETHLKVGLRVIYCTPLLYAGLAVWAWYRDGYAVDHWVISSLLFLPFIALALRAHFFWNGALAERASRSAASTGTPRRETRR